MVKFKTVLIILLVIANFGVGYLNFTSIDVRHLKPLTITDTITVQTEDITMFTNTLKEQGFVILSVTLKANDTYSIEVSKEVE